MDIKQRDADRFRLLREVYKLTEGRTGHLIPLEELADHLGMDEDHAEATEEYLVSEGLLTRLTRGHVGITHDGIKEVEQAMREPSEPTEHFPPLNVINVGTMIGSTIQQASPGADQTVKQEVTTAPDLGPLLRDLRDALGKLDLPGEARGDLEVHLVCVESQLRASRPNETIVREGLASIRRVLEGALAGAAGTMIAGSELVGSLIGRIGNLIGM